MRVFDKSMMGSRRVSVDIEIITRYREKIDRLFVWYGDEDGHYDS